MLEYTSIWNWVPLCIQWNFRSEKLYSWSTMSEFRIFYSNIIHVLHRCSCNIRWWIKSFSCMKITRRRTIKRTTRRNVGVVFLRWRNKFIIRGLRSRWNQNFFLWVFMLPRILYISQKACILSVWTLLCIQTKNVFWQSQEGTVSNWHFVFCAKFLDDLFS